MTSGLKKIQVPLHACQAVRTGRAGFVYLLLDLLPTCRNTNCGVRSAGPWKSHVRFSYGLHTVSLADSVLYEVENGWSTIREVSIIIRLCGVHKVGGNVSALYVLFLQHQLTDRVLRRARPGSRRASTDVSAAPFTPFRQASPRRSLANRRPTNRSHRA